MEKERIIIESIDDKIKCPKCNYEDVPTWRLEPDPDSLCYSAECDNCGIEFELIPNNFILQINDEEVFMKELLEESDEIRYKGRE